MAKALTRSSGEEWTQLPDCRGLTENGRCQWLNVAQCLGQGCPYCRRELNQDKVWGRLGTLSEEEQAHIASKYYGGSRPWTGGKGR